MTATGKVPAKYLAGLSKKDREAQLKNIMEARRAYKKGKYISRPKLKSYRKKKSSHVEIAKELYGVTTMRDLKTLSRKTGCSKETMKTILKKGKGAYYSSGSRPGQTGDSWAYARLASALTRGKSAIIDRTEMENGGCKESLIVKQKLKGYTRPSISALKKRIR